LVYTHTHTHTHTQTHRQTDRHTHTHTHRPSNPAALPRYEGGFRADKKHGYGVEGGDGAQAVRKVTYENGMLVLEKSHVKKDSHKSSKHAPKHAEALPELLIDPKRSRDARKELARAITRRRQESVPKEDRDVAPHTTGHSAHAAPAQAGADASAPDLSPRAPKGKPLQPPPPPPPPQAEAVRPPPPPPWGGGGWGGGDQEQRPPPPPPPAHGKLPALSAEDEDEDEVEDTSVSDFFSRGGRSEKDDVVEADILKSLCTTLCIEHFTSHVLHTLLHTVLHNVLLYYTFYCILYYALYYTLYYTLYCTQYYFTTQFTTNFTTQYTTHCITHFTTHGITHFTTAVGEG